MRVQILLPPDMGEPIGGFAVAYEYGSRLQRRGHDVEVVYVDRDWGEKLRRNPRSTVRRALRLRSRGPDWYSLVPGVRYSYRRHVPRRSGADAILATAWQTAEALGEAGVRAPQGFYLLQHHEVWAGEAEQVNATWRLPLTRIVISGWLADVARQLGALPVHQIANGIDMEVFSCRTTLEHRAPTNVAMMWHGSPWKGSAVGLAALARAQARVPDLRVHLFSVYPQPPDLPEWVTWHSGLRGAALSELLNRCAVFLSPSITEGWPLPPAEALASGCCLVSTDIPGVADYAEHEVTALLVPANDTDALAGAVERVVTDHELRLRLASAGHARIAGSFSWERAVDRMEALLLDVTRAGAVTASVAPQPQIG